MNKNVVCTLREAACKQAIMKLYFHYLVYLVGELLGTFFALIVIMFNERMNRQ